MIITHITRNYKRTVAVKAPDGKDAWIAHEASVEAELNEQDNQNLADCFSQLEEVVKAEVAGSVRREQEALTAARAQAAEPFPGQAPSPMNLERL